MDIDNSAQGAPRGSFAHAPTGFRRMTTGLLKADRAAESFAGLPEGVKSPGQLLATLKAAAPRLGISPRIVHAVDWLFRFTQPRDWEPGSRPIVWPSASMQEEALGLSATQVKETNRRLIELGLITMRDSPNGKRYGRRHEQTGHIIEAYGFDLSPLAARHAEFVRLAEEGRAERAAMGRLRRRATIARKAITQILEILLGVVDSAPKGPENRPHRYNYNPNLDPNQDTVIAAKDCSGEGEGAGAQSPTQEQRQRPEKSMVHGIRPDELPRLTPKLKPYLRRPNPAWPDIIDAADWLRHDLGVSKSLWGDACLAMGRELAAVALAIVSTKEAEHFQTSPGGYFHGMVAKAKAGELHLERSVWALRRAVEPEQHRRAGRGGDRFGRDGGRA
jgi:replication initiation protein RepC